MAHIIFLLDSGAIESPSTVTTLKVSTFTPVTIVSCLNYYNGLLINLHASPMGPLWFSLSYRNYFLNVNIIILLNIIYLLTLSQWFLIVLKIQVSYHTDFEALHFTWFYLSMCLPITITSSKATQQALTILQLYPASFSSKDILTTRVFTSTVPYVWNILHGSLAISSFKSHLIFSIQELCFLHFSQFIFSYLHA